MKNIFKYSCVALMATAALAFTACDDDDDYARYTEMSGAQVFFDLSTPTKYTLDANATSFAVTVKRANANEAASVPVTVVSDKIKGESTVNFPSGSTEGSLILTYNPEELEYDEPNPVTIILGGDVDKNFGITELNITATLPAPWETLGYAMYRDDFITTFFGVENVEYRLLLQGNLNEPGLYRLVNPYGKPYPYNEPGDYDDSKDYYMEINAKDPEKVYINRYNSGTDWGYGEFIMWSLAGYYLAKDDEASAEPYYGKLENGVITFPAGALLLAMADYNDGGLYSSNKNGMFRVVFPGVVLADYSAEVETVGRLIDTKENGQAIFNVTLGADVAQAKVAFDAGKDPNYAYEQIVNGDDAVVTLTASGEVRFAYDEPGDYVCLVVTYDANGNEQEAAYALINIPAGGAPETYSAVFVGTYTHGVESYSQSGAIVWEDDETGEPYTESSVLYFCDQNEDKYMISPWLNAGWEEIGTQGKGLVFLMDEEGNVTVPGSSTYVSDGKEDIIAVDLITANIADIPSAFDGDATFSFSLIWTTESYLPQGAGYGYTMDTFVLEGFAEAPANKVGAKLCVPAAAKKVATFGKKNFKNPEAKPAKKHTPLTFEWKKQLANLK